MKIDKHLERWVEQKLITGEQAERIIEFERQTPKRSWALFGIIGIGIVALMTGVISIVAANWQELGTSSKLFGYFLIQIALGGGFLKLRNAPGPLREVLLSCFALFFLAGIGLVGQIYNLQSDGYRGLLFWCLLSLPAALSSNGRLLPGLWHFALGCAVAIWMCAEPFRETDLRLIAAAGIAYAVYAAGILRVNGKSTPEHFRRASSFWGFIALAAVSIFANCFWYEVRYAALDGLVPLSIPNYMVFGLGALAAVGAFSLSTPAYPRAVRLTAAAAIISLSASIVGPLSLGIDGKLGGALVFALTWAFVAAAAASADRKRLFDGATLILALRIIVAYFEVFGSLAATGTGLIISGVVIIAIALGWHKYRSQVLISIRS